MNKINMKKNISSFFLRLFPVATAHQNSIQCKNAIFFFECRSMCGMATAAAAFHCQRGRYRCKMQSQSDSIVRRIVHAKKRKGKTTERREKTKTMDNTRTSFPGFQVKIARRLFSIPYSHHRPRRRCRARWWHFILHHTHNIAIEMVHMST